MNSNETDARVEYSTNTYYLQRDYPHQSEEISVSNEHDGYCSFVNEDKFCSTAYIDNTVIYCVADSEVIGYEEMLGYK